MTEADIFKFPEEEVVRILAGIIRLYADRHDMENEKENGMDRQVREEEEKERQKTKKP